MNPHHVGPSTQFVYSTIGSHPGVSSVRVDSSGQHHPLQMTQGYSFQQNYPLGNVEYSQSMPILYQNHVTPAPNSALSYPQTGFQNFNQIQSPTYVGGLGNSVNETVFFGQDLQSPVNNPNFVWTQPVQQTIPTSGYAAVSGIRNPIQTHISLSDTQLSSHGINTTLQQPQCQPYYQQLQHQQPTTVITNDNSTAGAVVANGRSSEVSTSKTNEKNGPFYVTSVRPAPPSTYRSDPIHPRQNTLPGSLPTRLNASLQLNQVPPPVTSSTQPVTYTASPEAYPRGEARRGSSLSGSKSEDDQATSGVGSSISSSTSPPGSSPTSPFAADRTESQWNTLPCYERPIKKDLCLRCNKKVYPMEQVGPIKDVLYHKNCFTCVSCGTKLHLKNFHHNPNDMDDLNVFCVTHRPKDRPLSCDANAVHIKAALSAPKLDKVNEQIRGDRYPSEVLARSTYSQPAASAFVTPRETAYYGMGAVEQQRKQQLQEQEQLQQQLLHQQNLHLQLQLQQEQSRQHQQAQQQQQQMQANEQQRDQQQQMTPRQLPEQHQQQSKEQVLLPQDLDSALTDYVDSNSYQTRKDSDTAESKDTTSHHPHVKRSASEDDVFDFDYVGYALGMSDTDSRTSPASSVSSRSSSHVPITRSDRPSAETIANDMTARQRLDQRTTSQMDGQQVRSDRPSSQASPESLRKESRGQGGAASVRSSTGSNISSRGSLDLDSSFSSQGRLMSSASSLERSDRPSVSQHHADHVTKGTAEHAPLSARSSGGSESARSAGDQSRYVPKKEVMRLDRPSQYS